MKKLIHCSLGNLNFCQEGERMELGSTPKQPSKNSAVRLSDKVLHFHGALVHSQNKTSLICGQVVLSPVHLIQYNLLEKI